MHPAHRADVAHRCICFRCPSARFRALWCCPRRASRRSRSRSPVRATSSRRTSILTRVRPAHIQYTASTRSLFWMACTLSSAGAGWLILPSLEALVVTTHATCFSALCISLRSVMHIKEQDALRPKHAMSPLKSVQKKRRGQAVTDQWCCVWCRHGRGTSHVGAMVCGPIQAAGVRHDETRRRSGQEGDREAALPRRGSGVTAPIFPPFHQPLKCTLMDAHTHHAQTQARHLLRSSRQLTVSRFRMRRPPERLSWPRHGRH